MSEKKSKGSNSMFNKVVYIAGTLALVFMLVFSAVNFLRDARVLKLPVLSSESAVDKDTKSSEDGGYKTLKYKKPATTTPKPQKTTAPKKPAVPTPKPAPKAIPSSEP